MFFSTEVRVPKHFGLSKLAWVSRSLSSFLSNLPVFTSVFWGYQKGWITSLHVRAAMTTVIKFRREGDMLFFHFVEDRQVKDRKIPFVFDSKRECFFFSTFTSNILKTSGPASKIFLQEMQVNMTLLSTHSKFLWRIDFNRDELKPKKSILFSIFCLAWLKWCLGTLMVIWTVFKKYWKRWVYTRTQLKCLFKETHWLCGQRILLNTLLSYRITNYSIKFHCPLVGFLSSWACSSNRFTCRDHKLPFKSKL